MEEVVNEIRKKREFSRLPDSIVLRAAEISKGDVKGARALLRKYFGVFLTNRVLKGSDEEILKFHMSSKKRDYNLFYEKIFEGLEAGPIVDLGCGVNGFSYPFLGDVSYLGVEASGQIVDITNSFFENQGYGKARVVLGDLFDLDFVMGLLRGQWKQSIVFMFQVVDALENLEKDYSKKLISKVMENCRTLVLTLPTESLGGRKRFSVQRKWLVDFLSANFFVEKDLEMDGERIFVIHKK